ncbi:MAG: hypothetical protein CL678_09795 [Bdellovibrionaceae bacterium]|nr:hypothetical protein [Pseudobdellovibrionaceae bacterium]|tara:strand:- start:1361 stop:1864 length:504 start_codon:yes stop_codon:yes gene_type:complete
MTQITRKVKEKDGFIEITEKDVIWEEEFGKSFTKYKIKNTPFISHEDVQLALHYYSNKYRPNISAEDCTAPANITKTKALGWECFYFSTEELEKITGINGSDKSKGFDYYVEKIGYNHCKGYLKIESLIRSLATELQPEFSTRTQRKKINPKTNKKEISSKKSKKAI